MLELDKVVNECCLDGDTEIAIQNILALDDKFSNEELVEIYNCILSVSKNPVILMQTIKLADRFRDKSTLIFIVDILLMKKIHKGDIDEEDFVKLRVLCAKAIANFKDTSVVTELLSCLNNKNEHYRVRLACADALGKIGDRYAVSPLIDIINDDEEKSVYLKESAASALGSLGDMRAIDSLVGILESKQGLINKFTFLKERVLEALCKLKISDNERAFRALKSSLLDESAQIRINAIEAIMESEHPDAVDTIKSCLEDSNEEVQKNALIALYNLIGRDILDEVISLPLYSDYLKKEAQSMIEEYEDE